MRKINLTYSLSSSPHYLSIREKKTKTKTQSYMNLNHLHHSSLVQAPEQSTFLSQNQDNMTQARSTTRNSTRKQFLTNINK